MGNTGTGKTCSIAYLLMVSVVGAMLVCLAGCSTVDSGLKPVAGGGQKKIPVILDTDIGTDIDDTWALVMMLKCPELDVKLIVTDHGNTTYRAKVTAKLLEVAGRTDIPIGIGLHEDDEVGGQGGWVEGYELSDYPGKIYEDGVGALIDTIMSSEEQITLLCIGPIPNIAEALKREPKIAEKAKFVGMHGSVRRGYNLNPTPHIEYNVLKNIPACQQAFRVSWEITIAPLDTCGIVWLDGKEYSEVYNCEDPLTRALIENYRMWSKNSKDSKIKSSILYDTVAVYLAFSEELVVMEKLGIEIQDDGLMRIDKNAKNINCAMRWRSLGKFRSFLVERLTSAQ